MLDINNLNLPSNVENEKSIEFDPEKELEVLHESTIIDSKNNNKNKINDNNSLSDAFTFGAIANISKSI